MKKTLIALAVLAASGASFAQATITGNYTFGWAQTTGGGVASASGLGTDTSDVNFAASEDLGGGMKASAKMGISGAHRGNAVTGNTASVSIGSSAFTLTGGTIESTNGLLAIGSSGASGYGLDCKSISGSSNIDIISLSVPLSSALTLGANYVDRGTGDTGLGLGTSGAASAQPSAGLSLTYAGGPLALKGDYTSWTRLNDATVTSNANKNRIRLSAAYDFGVARLSAGYSNLSRDTAAGVSTNGTVTETLLGLKVPAGALTFGLDYAVGTVTGQDDTSGYSLGVQYDLSKRTNISTSYANWKQRGITGNAFAANTEAQSGFRLYLSHSF